MEATFDRKEGTAQIRNVSRMPADIAATIVADSLSALGADAGFIATAAPDGRTLEIARVTPYARHPVRFDLPLEAPYPIAQAIRTGEPLVIENNEQLACDNPGLVRIRAEDHSCATLPLRDESGELLGAINLGFDEPRRFTPEQLGLIDLVARTCAQAMALARGLEQQLSR